ncbi:hypothetical protein L1049_010529 [Liquidambar formosana]|uniref:Uncharacterized protein n=1 Tax=Liquidambar formosana TaxID=63359 RepID=A0AAP0N7V4_LIQFO
MAEAPKPEEISHPPMDQLQGLEYCIDSNPSWGEAIALGFQHYILALGTAVMIPTFLVPLMGGSDNDKVRVVQTLLFVEGINTLLQTLFGTRLPTVVGGSYAFMVPIISYYSRSVLDENRRSSSEISQHHESSPRCSYSSIKRANYSGVQSNMGYLFQVGRCVEIGIPMLLLFVILSQYLKHFQAKQLPILERFALLISITVIWAYAHLLTASGAYKHRPELTQDNCRTDRANLISSAPWIKIPYPLQWGAPTFDAGHAFGMMAAVLVSLIEVYHHSTHQRVIERDIQKGNTDKQCVCFVSQLEQYKAASRLASATPPPAHVLSRGIGWQKTYMGLHNTGNRDPPGWTLWDTDWLYSLCVRKFGALFASIPFTIFAAVYCVVFGLVASVGLSFLQFTNMNSMRNLFITGVAFFLGLSVPEYFREYTAAAHYGPAHTRAGWFNDFLNTIFFSSPTVALIVAIFLDNTLDYKDSARDRGMPWWVKFRTFKGDSRNEEFYTLPFNLNRFFPPS